MDSVRKTAASRRANLLEALAAGKPNQAAYEALWMAASTWLAYGGGIPIERFAGLPKTGPALTTATRDLWLCRAARAIQPGTPFAQANELASEFEKFITRGPWSTWCKSQHPPAEVSELRTALFYATKFNGGELILARTIYRALS